MNCRKCGTRILPRWRTFANRTRHIEARCPNVSCKCFLGWLPQTTENALEANRNTVDVRPPRWPHAGITGSDHPAPC